ncbi:DUF5134 domain-containing protein [Microlunatus elymi]|uniref:DUF5134 domain-containing protein n=1 Tax=Microlunatus elymi TaxID=2596828 RepID=UPI00143DBC23|nr:DUF5134 domain-containing protein [Microlunatus elymi]
MTPTTVAIIGLFVLCGLFYAVRMITAGSGPDRIFDASHLVMSAVMIMMSVGWSERIPAVLLLTVFTGFALWYVYLAMFRPYAVHVLVGDTAGADPSHHSGRPRLIYHAAMMLAMAGMAVIMAPVPTAGAMSMTMPGHTHGAGSSSPPPLPAQIPLHTWAAPLSIMIGIGFAAAALWYVARFVRFAGTRPITGAGDVRRLTDLASAALMAAGMALTFLVDMT